MGLSIPQETFDANDYDKFSHRLRECVEVLGELLRQPHFGEGEHTLGAELEVSLVDSLTYRPLPVNRGLLAKGLDPSFQLELDRFNLECNLEPVSSKGMPFSALEHQLHCAVQRVDALAAPLGGRVVPIGILPTLTAEDLEPSALSDLPRFRALSAGIRRLRRCPFLINIDGLDPLRLSCDDVTLEGANTSFQLHLRVPVQEFARLYNAAQIATPLAVAVGANSPIFLGHRLWDETRVALFKQAVESRPPHEVKAHCPARVSFGHRWVEEGASELFSEAVDLFPPLLPVVSEECPITSLRHGRLPRLDELRLHQGTVWRWNRAIYDPACGGHLRIEFRALPSGPTPIDMVATAAFLIGATLGITKGLDSFLPYFSFESAHQNFYRAAQHGLNAILLWPREHSSCPLEIPAWELASSMMVPAKKGLRELGVHTEEIDRLLGIIQQRIQQRVTPALWQRLVLDSLEPKLSRPQALVEMLKQYLSQVETGKPVTEWARSWA